MRNHPSFFIAPALGVVVLAACSITTNAAGTGTGNKPNFGVGPAIPAANVGGYCSGVGTSPGETAAFQSSDCPGGYCLADARTDFNTYCTADCSASSCPAGYLCAATSFDSSQYMCMIDPSYVPTDAGSGTDGAVSVDSGPTCSLLLVTGNYNENFTLTGTGLNCGPIDSKFVYIEKGVGVDEVIGGCTSAENATACTLTEHCSSDDSDGATTVTDTTINPDLTGTMKYTETVDSSGIVEGSCTYAVTLTKS